MMDEAEIRYRIQEIREIAAATQNSAVEAILTLMEEQLQWVLGLPHDPYLHAGFRGRIEQTIDQIMKEIEDLKKQLQKHREKPPRKAHGVG